MSKYDFTFLLNEEAELKTIKDLITSLKGKVTKEDNWGKKTLAFSIKKTKVVNFYNWQIEMETKTMKELRDYAHFNYVSQKKIAEIFGVNQLVVSSWFKGKSMPRKSTILKIEKFLDDVKGDKK